MYRVVRLYFGCLMLCMRWMWCVCLMRLLCVLGVLMCL